MTMTLTAALARHNITAADEALAEIEVPVLAGMQRQGDVLIVPRPRIGAAERTRMTLVPREGVHVVRGEATGNSHILDAVEGVVLWGPHESRDPDDLVLGIVHVEVDSVAHLIHTEEHGCNALAAGTYVLTGKRQMADEIRKVAD